MTSPLVAEITRLRAKLDEVTAERDYFKGMVRPTDGKITALMQHYGLSPTEAALIAILADGGLKRRDALLVRCCREDTAPKTLDAHICRIRQKIRPLKIITHWGAGYSLEGEHLAAIREIIKGDA